MKKISDKSIAVRKYVLFVLAFAVLVSGAAMYASWLKGRVELNPRDVTEIDADYDASAGVIDTDAYDGTVLRETEDAGQDYIDSTVFLGDSNTARFNRYLSEDNKTTFTSVRNTIGVVGMGIDAISSLPCMEFSTGRYTMPQAVAILQPERVIITFGTNNLYGTSTDAAAFIQRYEKQIQAVEKAYPSVDIIIAAIPPVAKVRDYTNISMTQVDAYNKAIVKMCEENGWKFLNTAEALKDEKTGFAKEGYLDKDGLHFSRQGLITLFAYIRTHAYITEDDRPKPLKAIPTVIGVVPNLIQINPLNNEEFGDDVMPDETQQTAGETFTVPNAKTLGELRSWAAGHNIMIAVSPANAADSRRILTMDPAAGASIREGETIKVTLQAADTVTVPEFKTKDQAVNWGDKNGIRIAVSYIEDGSKENGTVVSQSVAAGSTIEKGKTISVTVIQNPETTAPPTDSPTPTPTDSTEPTPTPSDSPSPTPTPSESTDPGPSPTPSESTDPSPSPTPSESTDPSPTPTPPPHVHSYTATVTAAATCDTPGVMTYTCSCGDSYTEAIPATGGCSTPEPTPSETPPEEPLPEGGNGE